MFRGGGGVEKSEIIDIMEGLETLTLKKPGNSSPMIGPYKSHSNANAWDCRDTRIYSPMSRRKHPLDQMVCIVDMAWLAHTFRTTMGRTE